MCRRQEGERLREVEAQVKATGREREQETSKRRRVSGFGIRVVKSKNL